jgi:hypothetical protein
MPQDLTPEEQLCLLLCRGRFSPDVAKRAVDQMQAGVHWDVLLERATTHGLIPLLYHRLRALDFRGVPPSARRNLADTFGVNAIRNMLLTEELVRVLTQLGAAGVPVIPLKGIALAESLYGDAALRNSADLDILIHPKYLVDSLHLLESVGYRARWSDPSWVRLLARYGKDCLLMREDARRVYPLQVHCGLIWGGPAEQPLLAELWSDAAPRPFHAAPAYALSPEWEFLYLAVHAARHGYPPYKWLVDLDWLLLRGGIDWDKVQEKAMRLGWKSVIKSCLAACFSLLETPIPEPFGWIARHSPLESGTSGAKPLQIPRETIFALRLLPTYSQRFRFLATRLFVPTPADSGFLRLPSSLFFLYYFVRPWRLMVAVAGWFIQAGIARVRRLLRRGP